MLRNNVVRYSVGLFVFTLVFAVQALNRQEASVAELVSLVTAVLGVACIADFLFLIDYAARLLRPVAVVARVGDGGVAMIKSVYPDPATALPPESAALRGQPTMPTREVEHRGTSEIVLAVDLSTLVALAQRHDGMIEFVPQVGDFLAVGEPLFVLHGGAMAIDDRVVQSSVAFGPERTLEQDPMFAFRIIVDIALKALSPAINDPTTAVLALDQVHRLLRLVGQRKLRGEVIVDESGRPRVIFRTPNWEHYVQVACSEIRACGAGNLQVARRMRAMLENLRRTLPEHRHAAIAAGEMFLGMPGDLALADLGFVIAWEALVAFGVELEPDLAAIHRIAVEARHRFVLGKGEDREYPRVGVVDRQRPGDVVALGEGPEERIGDDADVGHDKLG